MSIISPPKWNSAHSPVIYRVEFPNRVVFSVADNAGSARFTVGTLVAGYATVGMRVFVPSGLYAGNHRITSKDSNTITISAAYISNETLFVKLLENLTCELWAGYPSTHEGYVYHPYRKIADIDQPPGINGSVELDVSGFIASMFKSVLKPRGGRDFHMSVPFHLTSGGVDTPLRYGINGTLRNTSLGPTFDVPHKVLRTGAVEPIHFANAWILYSVLWQDESVHGPHVVNLFGVHGTGMASMNGGIGFDSIGLTFTIA